MILLQFAPIVLAALLLAAHALRSGHLAVVAVVLAWPALFAVRKPWAAMALQLGLAAGTLEWLRTAAALIQARRELGEPYLRLAAILGSVAVATSLCLFVFRSRRARQHFRIGPPGPASN